MFSYLGRPVFRQVCIFLFPILWIFSSLPLPARGIALFEVEPVGMVGGKASADTLSLTAVRNVSADRLAEARDLVAQGFRLYEKVDFEGALDLFRRAGRLVPESVELRKLIDDTQRNQQRQSALYDLLTRQGVSVKDALKRWYQAAQELFERGEYDEARRGFYQVWLMAGSYGRTLTYLSRIEQIKTERVRQTVKETRQESEKPGPGRRTPILSCLSE